MTKPDREVRRLIPHAAYHVLSMGSAANVSQQLRRMNTRKAKVELPPKLQQFLTEALQNGN